jgi:hypothetical protein
MIAELVHHPARAAAGIEPAHARADRHGRAGRARSVRDDLDHGRAGKGIWPVLRLLGPGVVLGNRSLPTRTRSGRSWDWCRDEVTAATGNSVLGPERVDYDTWAASMRTGIGSDGAGGGLALPLVITTELPGADRVLQPGLTQTAVATSRSFQLDGNVVP